jgi:5-methyltetrahydropteroyltriglutamate--homocysteine methyltransferase
MSVKFRADHVGSLLRPPALLAARKDYEAGSISLDRLREIEDESVLEAIKMQRDAGLEIVTDGEYRRAIWYSPLSEGLEGLVPSPEPPATPGGIWHGKHAALATETLAEVSQAGLVVGEKLRRTRRMTGHESGFLAGHAAGPWKMTIPGVLTRANNWYRAGITDKAYPSRQDLIDDLVQHVRNEVQALVDEGCAYFQLDSLLYVIQLANPQRRAAMIAQGLDPDKLIDDLIAADNACIEPAKLAGITVGLHMCRGNNRSAWATEGSYEVSAAKAFSRLNVDRFLLEYDTDRAGGFEPLRFVPKDKVVVLGLISSKEPRLESQDELRRRIDEAAKYVPFENLAISPQCGFASTAPGNMLSWDEQRRKLELVVETARKVWG